MNAKRMDFILHHVGEGIVNHSMPFQRRHTGKYRGYDIHRVMTATGFGAFVAGVQCAVITDFQAFGSEHGIQAFLNALHPVVHQGSTFLKGLTITDSYTPASI